MEYIKKFDIEDEEEIIEQLKVYREEREAKKTDDNDVSILILSNFYLFS